MNGEPTLQKTYRFNEARAFGRLGCFLVLYGFCLCAHAGPGYSVQGRFKYQVFDIYRTNTYKPLLRHFDATVSSNSWRITIILDGNNTFDNFIYYFDGTDLFQYSSLGGTNSGAKSAVTVETCEVPRAFTSAGGEYVWLAFASGAYFSKVTNNTVIALDPLANSKTGAKRRYEVPCSFELQPSFPRLPKRLEYFQLHALSLLDTGLILTNAILPELYSNGYRSADYLAGDFINKQGIALPSSFQYRRYRPRPKSLTTNDFVVSVLVEGVVTNTVVFAGTNAQSGTIANVQIETVSNELSGRRVQVHDLRFPEPNVKYAITLTNPLPATDSPRLQPARTAAIKLQEQLKKQVLRTKITEPPKSRFPIILATVAILLLPVGVIVIKLIHGRATKQQN